MPRRDDEVVDLGQLLRQERREPGEAPRRFKVPIIRPRDHLVLSVRISDCVFEVDDDGKAWLRPAPDGEHPRLIVELPPQHVNEQVFQEHTGAPPPPALPDPDTSPGAPEDPKLPAGARFSFGSRLAFELGKDDAIEFTSTGLLTAMSRLPMAVGTLADPRFIWRILEDRHPAEVIEQVRGIAAKRLDAPVRPANETVLDRVRATRLLAARGLGARVLDVEPEQRIGALDVSPELLRAVLFPGERVEIDPGRIRLPRIVQEPDWDETAVEVPSRLQLSPSVRGGWAHAIDADPATVVELWNTRLGVRAGTPEAPTVDEGEPAQRIVRALWNRDRDVPAPYVPFRSSLTRGDRDDVVTLSSGEGIDRRIPVEPIQVNKLHLTSLGAFMDVRGFWPGDGGEASLEEWQHRTTLGRDQYVKTVRKGYLYPFGHKAVLVTETRRRADPNLPDGDFAILWQRHFIVIREREKYFGGPEMPFTSVAVDPKTTPDIDDPGPEPHVLWPRINGEQFRFKITAVDREGDVHGYAAPLLWIEQGAVSDGRGPEIRSAYGLDVAFKHANDAEGVLQDLGGRRIAVAQRGPAGEATYETATLRFGAIPDDITCEPELLFGEFVIPAIAATTGQKSPHRFGYAEPHLDPNAANLGEVVLANAPGVAAPELKFGSSAASGGFLNPSQHIAGIARGKGPVADIAASAAGNPTNPADLFAGLGKILGLFELKDVLPALGPDQVPAYAAQLLDPATALTDALRRAAAHLTGAAATDLGNAAAQLDAAVHSPPHDFAAALVAANAAVSPSLDGLGLAERAIADRALETARAILKVLNVPGGTDVLDKVANGEPVSSLLNHVHLEWRPPVKNWPANDVDAIFLAKRDGRDAGLLLVVDIRGGNLTDAPSVDVVGQLTNFTLQLAPGVPLVHLPFERLYFRATTGKKTEIDVKLGTIEWLGVLGFVDRLRQLIPLDGFSDPPAVTVEGDKIKAGFSQALPSVPVGVFNLSNLSLAAQVTVPFVGTSPTVGFSFCARERPFTVAVMFLGGGGFFGVQLDTKGLVLLEAAIEFGATLALDFGVASGSVSCMAGVYFRLESGNGKLTGYLRIRGEVDVLGLASASLEMYMGLDFEPGSGKVVGQAKITVEIEVGPISKSVSISAERKFSGSKGDPSFEQALGPYVDAGCPWIDYCDAFAGV